MTLTEEYAPVPDHPGGPPSPSPARLRRLVALLAPARWGVALTTLLAFATLASGVGLIAMAAFLISRAAELESTATLALTITGVRFFAVCRAVSRYLERFIGHRVTFRLLTGLRVWFFRGIEPLAPARLHQRRAGDLLARILGDIDALQDLALRVAVPAAAAAFTAVLAAAVLGSFSVAIGVIAFAYLVVVGLVLPAIARRAGRTAAGEVVAARGALEAETVESVTGLAEIVAWGREDRLERQVVASTELLCSLDRRLARVRGAADALGAALVGLAAMTVLAVAVPLVRDGTIEGVHLAILPLVTLAAFEAVTPLAGAMEHLGRARSAAARLDDLVAGEPTVTPPQRPAPTPAPAAPDAGLELTVSDLDFAYSSGGPPALRDLSFHVPAGAVARIVGASGSGKSTLVALLLRFWDCPPGSISIGGSDLRELDPDEARRLVATVTQDDHLFDTSVRDNLLLAAPDAEDDRLLAALDAAAALDVVRSLDGGLDARVGENGGRLSGGERQRLMIARALLAEAPILVLDEATAHLDGPTRAAVLDGVRRWQGRRTLILVAHEVEVGVAADVVVDLDRRTSTRRSGGAATTLSP